jgi:lipoprotein-anchoring transpeptidase ErfK/SrfK
MRLARLFALAVFVAALAATPSLADGSPPAQTSTAAAAPATAPPAATRATVHVDTVFPAAGQLQVDSVPVRVSPNPQARVIKVMHQFRSDYRIQEILALSTTVGKDGKPWYRISIPMRPNGTKGWIPARTVSVKPTVSQIVVNRGARTIDIYWHGKRAVHAIVAIGAPGRETPVGHYYVAARFVPDDPFLGVFAVETSAYSKLTEWPGGGVVGIHGTSEPQLLGQAVSHGCVRVANTTAAAMRKLAPLGTPITITG